MKHIKDNIPTWINTITALNEPMSISDLSKQMYRQYGNSCYSHIHIIVKLLHNQKFVKFKKNGRKKIIKLTVKGKKLRNIILQLNSLIGADKK